MNSAVQREPVPKDALVEAAVALLGKPGSLDVLDAVSQLKQPSCFLKGNQVWSPGLLICTKPGFKIGLRNQPGNLSRSHDGTRRYRSLHTQSCFNKLKVKTKSLVELPNPGLHTPVLLFSEPRFVIHSVVPSKDSFRIPLGLEDVLVPQEHGEGIPILLQPWEGVRLAIVSQLPGSTLHPLIQPREATLD